MPKPIGMNLFLLTVLPSLIFSAPKSDVPADTLENADEMEVTVPTMDLLPTRLSPMENLLWGKHGAIRSLASFPLTMENREKEMKWRRSLLATHQIMGLTTLGSMVTTVVCGQLVLNGNRDLGDVHSTFAAITIGSYALTALFSLSTPPPLIRRGEWNTVSWHKTLAWVHLTGMILTPVLGSFLEDGEESSNPNRNVQKFHQISGYLTTAAFAGAILVVTF